MFTEEDLVSLRYAVGSRMSEKRFKHTLGVEQTAAAIGKYFLPDRIGELRAAALLHDIAKEIPESEMKAGMQEIDTTLSDSDRAVPEAYHSFIGPLIIKRDFPNFALDSILSAVYDHTLGSPCMDVFSMIIFISDYIEPGRVYDGCRKTSEYLLSNLTHENSFSINFNFLVRACVMCIDYTETSLVRLRKIIHPKTTMTKTRLLSLI